MLADRLRTFGIVSASILGLAGVVAVLAEPRESVAAPVTVAMTEESVDTPVREVQYLTAPAPGRKTYCRYPRSRMAPYGP